MTIAITTTRNDYQGNSATAAYAFTFPITVSTDLAVYVRDLANVQHKLVLNTDYVVSGAGEAAGGSITLQNTGSAWLTGGFLLTGCELTLLRSQPLTQATSIRNQGSYYPETIENALDGNIMKVQQLEEELSRTMQLAITDDGGIGPLPLPADRASKFLAFDSSGNPIASGGTPGGVAVSAFMATVLDDTTAPAARTTLGFSGASGTAATANIEDGAVTTAKLADGAATSAKLASGAATGLKRLLTVAASKTTTYAILTTDDFVPFNATSAGFTATLPTAVGLTGKTFVLKKTDSTLNVVTIATTSSQTIDGITTTTLNTQYESILVVSDGANWHIVDRRVPSIWAAPVATVITGTTTNPTKGTIGFDWVTWARFGGSALIRYLYSQTGAGSAGSGTYLWALPTGLVADTTRVQASTSAFASGALSQFVSNDGSGSFAGFTSLYDSTHLKAFANAAVVGSANQGLGNASISHAFTVQIPISGWNG